VACAVGGGRLVLGVAADKAAVLQVGVLPCQLLDSDM
jgi:hypothetical protein